MNQKSRAHLIRGIVIAANILVGLFGLIGIPMLSSLSLLPTWASILIFVSALIPLIIIQAFFMPKDPNAPLTQAEVHEVERELANLGEDIRSLERDLSSLMEFGVKGKLNIGFYENMAPEFFTDTELRSLIDECPDKRKEADELETELKRITSTIESIKARVMGKILNSGSTIYELNSAQAKLGEFAQVVEMARSTIKSLEEIRCKLTAPSKPNSPHTSARSDSLGDKSLRHGIGLFDNVGNSLKNSDDTRATQGYSNSASPS